MSRVFELVHTVRFEAARQLTGVPPGHPCGRLYGLGFDLDIHVQGTLDAVTGFVIDFGEIDKAFKPLHDQLDHDHLNRLPGLENPTTEILVAWIWDRLAPQLPGLCQLVLRENPTSKVIFRG